MFLLDLEIGDSWESEYTIRKVLQLNVRFGLTFITMQRFTLSYRRPTFYTGLLNDRAPKRNDRWKLRRF